MKGMCDEQLSVKIAGSSFKTRLRLNAYLSKNAGFYLDLGYDLHTFRIKEFDLDISDDELEEDINHLLQNRVALKLRGLHAGVGVAVKF